MAVVITSNGGGDKANTDFAENLLTAVTTVVATAPGEIEFSIIGGLDAADFVIDAATGALTFAAVPDFEAPADSNKNNIYEVKVKATSGAESDIQTIYVAVKDGAGITITGTDDDDVIWDGTTLPDGIPAADFTSTGDDDAINAGKGNDLINGGKGADTMIGGKGDDDYFVDNANDTVIEAADDPELITVETEGNDAIFSSVSFTNAANVETLVLLGNTAINATGLDGQDDILVGNSAANVLDGKGGDDQMEGGKGNDTYYVDSEAGVVLIGDSIVEAEGEGIDTVVSTLESTSLESFGYIESEEDPPVMSELENLKLGDGASSGEGNALNNVITGNDDNNLLMGLEGDDRLDAGTGADHLEGGDGNDTYVVDDAGDEADEVVGLSTDAGGIDTVEASVEFTLGSFVENLTLTGKAVINGTGNDIDNFITGNEADNELTGKGGNDTLRGGLGADKMTGGAGKDIYYVDNIGDQCIETGGSTVETVYATVDFTLGANLEVLEFLGTGNRIGTGNDLDNTLVGNSGKNTLDGGKGDDSISGGDGNDTLTGGEDDDTLNGGDGADAMTGGTGNDTYVINQSGDVVTENSGEGDDDALISLSSSLDISLTGQFANIEHVTLKANVGKGLDITGNGAGNNLTGQYYANVIKGEGGNDVIDGKQGADQMFGGLGDDTFYVDNAGDQTKESATEGTDLVRVRGISWTLGDNLENLTLDGKSTINATGNIENNVLTGNIRANVLSGLGGDDTINGGNGADTLIGGAGKDTMTGGSGGDRFVFTALTDTTLVSTTTDVIADFVQGEDKINVSAIDADAVTALDQAFKLDTNASFSVGEFRQSTVSGNTFLEFNTDADSAAEMSILVTGLVTFANSDFVL